jgi:hypothetical protein
MLNWVGLILAFIGGIIGLWGGFHAHSLGWTATGIVIFVIGIAALRSKQ